MSSLVTEVLLQAGKLDKDDLRTKVSKLSSVSYELKKKICDILEQKYGEFNPMCSTCQSLLKELSEQQSNAQDIQGTLSGVVKMQLQDSTSEFERLSEEHAQTSALLSAIEKICEITNLLDNFAISKGDKNMINSATSLLHIHSILKNIESTEISEIKVFQFLKESYLIHSENLKYFLGEEWRNRICWTLPANDNVSSDVELKLPCLEESVDDNSSVKDTFQDLINASEMLDFLKRKLQEFAKLMMFHILKPLINEANLEPLTEIKSSDQPASMKISLVRSSVKTAEDKERYNIPAHTFRKVVTVLHCINANFLCLKIKDGKTLMSMFSDLIRDDLLELLVNKCLAQSIPKNKEELDNYKEVADVVTNFESSLRDINFIPEQTDPTHPICKLTTYAANVSFHFANQRCTDILKQARSIMHKDVHNTVQINEKDANLVFMQLSSTENETDLMRMPVGTGFDSQKPSKLISDNTLQLPKCRVSQCAKDIMQLAYETLKEASHCDPSCATQLVNTAQNIFELYAAIVPIYHKESLETLPQLSAIFHNDCMYIAHHLLTLGHQFSTIFSGASTKVKSVTFVHQVPMIRRLGAECFLLQLKRQNDIILQCLEPLRTFTENISSEKYNSAERAMKQILHLLNHLKKIWSEVLPINITRRSLCTLINSCIGELVMIICVMEDISADDSVSLKLVCLLLLDQVPGLFKSDENLEEDAHQDVSWQKQVPRWSRLQELTILLSASLRETVDRWSMGKGPLAATFSTIEVKALIRALFQNTEHRAQALLKIRM